MTISAKIIDDSVGPAGQRVTTMQLRYPKMIHSEFMTHRVFSRNASSSRAIPVERLIQDVIDDPVYPSFWGKNQAGMQAAEECDARIKYDRAEWDCTDYSRKEVWDHARDAAIEFARAFAKAGYHKQIANRIIEPFCHINVVCTSTEWSNFFALRCHPAAQPEMRELAEKMRDALAASVPQQLGVDEWHLPYVPSDDGYGRKIKWDSKFDDVPSMIKVSVARCARVSYLTQEGRRPTMKEDLALYDRLAGSTPLHASPCEHQATPDRPIAFKGPEKGAQPCQPIEWSSPELHGNLVGFIQYRKTLPGEC